MAKPRKSVLTALLKVDTSPIHGRGLFAKVDIRKNEYLGTFQGPRATRDGMHVLWIEDEEGNWAGRIGKNRLRYLNHSKKPNADFEDFDLYAIRNIKAGEEVTIDYGEGF